MKNIINFSFFAFLMIILSACSSKVQTNKLPDEKKYNFPQSKNYKKAKIGDEIVNDFDNSLKDFFKYKEQFEDNKNIYKTGMGYFYE
ncbi:TPA: hypothetical protein R8E37_001471 [Campylobacter coli]|nr:hypothetical protein [Campylobacter coli]